MVDNDWGFIDGTIRKTYRPSYFQRHAHSGHKRCHGLKVQSIVTLERLTACLWRPMTANRHDSYMLRESKLLHKLRELIPERALIYAMYGDPAHP